MTVCSVSVVTTRDQCIRSRLEKDPVVAGFSKVFPLGAPMPNIPEMGKVWGPWGNAISLAIQRPDSNVKKIVEDMVAEIKKAIGR